METRTLNIPDKQEMDKEKYQHTINSIIGIKTKKDLTRLLVEVYDYEWNDDSRQLFLIGVLLGLMFQYDENLVIEELQNRFGVL